MEMGDPASICKIDPLSLKKVKRTEIGLEGLPVQCFTPRGFAIYV